MKKGILLISLIALLSSCGGGGGGASQSSEPTPVSNNNFNNNGNNNSNNNNISNDIGNNVNNSNSNIDNNVSGNNMSNNNSNNTNNANNNNNVNNSSNNGNSNSENGGNKDNINKPNNENLQNENNINKPNNENLKNKNNENNPKIERPKDNKTYTGKDIKVGILDGDFHSGNKAVTKSIHLKLNNGFLEGETFDKVIEEEFGDRFVKIERENKNFSGDDHGITVATILAGKNGNGAKEAKLYGGSFGEGKNAVYFDVETYRRLREQGVKIYNQSLGTPVEFTDFNINNYKNQFVSSIKIENGVSTWDRQLEKVDELLNFYRDEVENGSLFVWAAGNRKPNGTLLNQVSIQAGLPKFIPSLEKGWIAVVGLTNDKKEFSPHLARAGNAKYWTISASGECNFQYCEERGSSFAAPRVTAVVAKVQEKFPWMSGNELRQTILTTAEDLGEYGVDGIFGWGFLDEEKALKGPAKFDNILLEGENAVNTGKIGKFNANIPEDITSIFENNIDGDGGLEKKGKGTLILSGNNSYRGNTEINDGTVEIYGDNGSNIFINQGGTLKTYPETFIGLKEYYGVSPKNVENNGGIFENVGSGAVITGDYIAKNGAITRAEIGKKITVQGQVNLENKATLQLMSNNYVSSKPINTTVIEANNGINGNFETIKSSDLINVVSQMSENNLDLTVSRKNVEEYVNNLENSNEMQKDTAKNIEIAFSQLDKELETGNSKVSQFSESATKLQKLSSSTMPMILDSLSGQIYASAQALTFQQSETMNKDLSNRLTMLGNEENSNKFGVWISGITANGKVRKQGYGTGKTKVKGHSVGIDKKINDKLITGVALNYSDSNVEFDRFGGESKSENFGVSLYGRYKNENSPLYIQGRAGVGFVTSDVERNIILANNDIKKQKINHKDKVYSVYLENGYSLKNNSKNIEITPFVGIAYDRVERGQFSENNSDFGLVSSKKNYMQIAGLVGLKANKKINWKNGVKTTLESYVTYQRAFNDEDLSFKANYKGLANAEFDVKGIGLEKNKIWTGIGILNEINQNFGFYMNYDGKFEKNKLNNNIFSTGVRIKF